MFEIRKAAADASKRLAAAFFRGELNKVFA